MFRSMRNIVVILRHRHETGNANFKIMYFERGFSERNSLSLTVNYKMPANEFDSFLCAISNVGQRLTRFVLKIQKKWTCVNLEIRYSIVNVNLFICWTNLFNSPFVHVDHRVLNFVFLYVFVVFRLSVENFQGPMTIPKLSE